MTDHEAEQIYERAQAVVRVAVADITGSTRRAARRAAREARRAAGRPDILTPRLAEYLAEFNEYKKEHRDD